MNYQNVANLPKLHFIFAAARHSQNFLWYLIVRSRCLLATGHACVGRTKGKFDKYQKTRHQHLLFFFHSNRRYYKSTQVEHNFRIMMVCVCMTPNQHKSASLSASSCFFGMVERESHVSRLISLLLVEKMNDFFCWHVVSSELRPIVKPLIARAICFFFWFIVTLSSCRVWDDYRTHLECKYRFVCRSTSPESCKNDESLSRTVWVWFLKNIGGCFSFSSSKFLLLKLKSWFSILTGDKKMWHI